MNLKELKVLLDQLKVLKTIRDNQQILTWLQEHKEILLSLSPRDLEQLREQTDYSQEEWRQIVYQLLGENG